MGRRTGLGRGAVLQAGLRREMGEDLDRGFPQVVPSQPEPLMDRPSRQPAVQGTIDLTKPGRECIRLAVGLAFDLADTVAQGVQARRSCRLNQVK